MEVPRCIVLRKTIIFSETNVTSTNDIGESNDEIDKKNDFSFVIAMACMGCW